MKARGGATLVEVMLAGSIAALLTLCFLEGVIVSTKIAHENAQLLAAEAFAWDVAWRWLNKPYDDLSGSSAGQFYPEAGYETVSSNACPMLCRELNGGADARLYVRVRGLSGGDAPRRHGDGVAGKMIDVNVEWGPSADRRCLNGLVSTARRFNVPVSVFKGPVERGL